MIEALNRDCFCVSLDRDALRRALDDDPVAAGLSSLIEARCPHLFAAMPVFVSREHVTAMQRFVAAAEEVIALPAYRDEVLSRAPDIARKHPGARGVFIGYDFHLGAAGPKLIEINTNAGGALLNGLLARAQRACCEEVAGHWSQPVPAERLERTLFDMFVREWRLSGRAGMPRRVAIVDDEPRAQFLYPEFLLFERLFRAHGVAAEVLAPGELVLTDGELRSAAGRIDLVYNRLTDFLLEEPAHAVLRAAYLSNAATVTPHPFAHALYADKRNLALLGDPARLAALGAREQTIKVLAAGIPRTREVSAGDAGQLWRDRRKLFFKPASGFGSRGAYRGDKMTRRVWSEIVQGGGYVAQELVPPSERRIGPATALKLDVRNYAYAGEVQLVAARLYQGQATNLRTAGGGFAPVVTAAAHAEALAVA